MWENFVVCFPYILHWSMVHIKIGKQTGHLVQLLNLLNLFSKLGTWQLITFRSWHAIYFFTYRGRAWSTRNLWNIWMHSYNYIHENSDSLSFTLVTNHEYSWSINGGHSIVGCICEGAHIQLHIWVMGKNWLFVLID